MNAGVRRRHKGHDAWMAHGAPRVSPEVGMDTFSG